MLTLLVKINILSIKHNFYCRTLETDGKENMDFFKKVVYLPQKQTY